MLQNDDVKMKAEIGRFEEHIGFYNFKSDIMSHEEIISPDIVNIFNLASLGTAESQNDPVNELLMMRVALFTCSGFTTPFLIPLQISPTIRVRTQFYITKLQLSCLVSSSVSKVIRNFPPHCSLES